jgi:heptosyltransferase II
VKRPAVPAVPVVVNRLVILAPNWLGDAVMALPTIADARRAWPAATITVAARPAVASLVGLVPEVNDTIVFERRSWPRGLAAWRDAAIEQLGRGFDAALLLPNSFHAAMMVARAGIPERWGYRTDWRGWLLTQGVDPPVGLHQGAYYQRLAAGLGISSGPLTPRVEVSEELRASGARLLEASGWDGRAPLVALAPGAAYGRAKRWPPASFAALVGDLAGDGVMATVVGSTADIGTGAEMERALGRRATVINLMGRTDVPTLAGVLANCRTIVSNDSGAMHFAAAIGVSVTAVFGPTNERATAPLPAGPQVAGTGPSAPSSSRRQHLAVLTHPVWCRPCMQRECPLDHRCMRGVSVDRVLDAVRRSL